MPTSSEPRKSKPMNMPGKKGRAGQGAEGGAADGAGTNRMAAAYDFNESDSMMPTSIRLVLLFLGAPLFFIPLLAGGIGLPF